MKWLENRIPPPIVTLGIGFLMWAGTRHGPAPIASLSVRSGIAVLIGAAGLAIAGSGVREFRRASTTIDPVHVDAASTLVTTGIFGYTRNPMYVGFATLLAAWAVYLGDPWALAGPVVLAAFLNRFQIIPEERAMKAKFDDAYEHYTRRVRRWL
jgi:protein-S-isoprenylcysteine O-methyltransferase Ste14